MVNSRELFRFDETDKVIYNLIDRHFKLNPYDERIFILATLHKAEKVNNDGSIEYDYMTSYEVFKDFNTLRTYVLKENQILNVVERDTYDRLKVNEVDNE